MADELDNDVQSLLDWCAADKMPNKWDGGIHFPMQPLGPMGFYPRVASHIRAQAAIIADRDRRIEALTKALRMLVSLGPRAKHDLRAGVNHCEVCNAWDEAAEALVSAAGAEGEA